VAHQETSTNAVKYKKNYTKKWTASDNTYPHFSSAVLFPNFRAQVSVYDEDISSKLSVSAKLSISPALISGSLSMKELAVFLLTLNGMQVHRRA